MLANMRDMEKQKRSPRLVNLRIECKGCFLECRRSN